MPSTFENIVANRVLDLPWIIPRRVPFGEILHNPEGKAPRNVDIWYGGSDRSLWVQPSAVINNLPKSPALSISTTFQTPRADSLLLFPHTVSWFDWMMVGWTDRSFQHAPWLLKGCMSLTYKSSYPTVSIVNENYFVLALLVWSGCSVTRWLGVCSTSRVVRSSILSR